MADVELRELLRLVRATVARELRMAGLLADPAPILPPPCDTDAEAEILSALFCGYVETKDLKPLGSEHFSGRFGGECFAALVELEKRGAKSRWKR